MTETITNPCRPECIFISSTVSTSITSHSLKKALYPSWNKQQFWLLIVNLLWLGKGLLILQKNSGVIRFFLIFLFISIQASGNQHPDYNAIYDYGNDWVVFDKSKKSYIPYFRSDENELQTFSLKVDLSKYPKSYLLIEVPSASVDLFLDNKLYVNTQKQQWLVYNFDNLKSETRKNEVIFSFLTTATPSSITVLAGFPKKHEAISDSKLKRNDTIKLIPRTGLRYKSGLAVAFLISLVLTTFVSGNYQRIYQKFFSLRELFNLNVSDDLFLIGRPLDRPGLLILILTSMMSSLVIMLLDIGGFHLLDESIIFKSGDSFTLFISNFSKISIVIFTVFILKYFFLILMGGFFNIRNVVESHFFKNIQTTILLISLIFILLFIMYNLHIPLSGNIENYTLTGLIIFYLLRTVLIYFTINRERRIKILYLISYLCITEILPVTFGLNWLF